MARLCRAIAALACGLALASPTFAEPRWSRVDTPNFVIVGTGSDKHLQSIGAQFEGFRDALTHVLSPTITRTAVPTVVMAFPDERSFKPFEPVYQGKTVTIGGLFLGRRDINYVLLGPDRGPDSLRGVFHEYSHLIISNVAPVLPLWMNEGLAEYYSSFELGSDRNKVVIGRPILPHLRTLGTERWLPVKELLAITQASPEYNERSRRSIFYAESWALVHMMMHGEPDRSAAFSAYANDLSIGLASDAAWATRFGPQDIDSALRTYAARTIMAARQYTLPDKIAKVSGTPVELTPAGAEALFGDVLLALGQSEQALERFTRALALDATSSLALVGAARARSHPAPAPELTGEWLESYIIGAALLEAEPSRATRASARHALERVIAARPDLPNAQALYARALQFERADAPAATDALKKAHAAAPARDDYTLALAQITAWEGDTATARALLGGVIARPHLPGAREQALELMRRLVRGEPSPASGAASGETPLFRVVQPGEQRAEGMLERIDCSAGGITLSVRLPDRLATFHATRFADIDFITYRKGAAGGSITCGPRTPPDAVYVTWRPGSGTETAVAVEFLPAKN